VGLYRVSTAEQGHSGLGLEAQQASVRAFVEREGWTLVAEHQDIASRKDDRRPGFQAALTRCRQLGAVLGGDRGWRPSKPPCAAAAAQARQEEATRTAHRLALQVEVLRAEGVTTNAGMARALTDRGVATPRGGAVWTHMTVARVVGRVGA
jgi:hypothetical protein